MKRKLLVFIAISIASTLTQGCIMAITPRAQLPSASTFFEDEDFEDQILPIYDGPAYMPHHVSPPLTSYVLRFRFPASVKKIPALCGYYKGYRLRFNTDYCLINEKTPSDTFTLVIADDVNRRWQNNATKDLKRTGKKCRMFYITKKHDGGAYGWDVEEEKESNIPVVLPKTSIVIIFDPDLISTIKKNDDLMKVKTASHSPLYLPIIEIKPEVTCEKLSEACTEAWCAALDTRGIHCPVSATTKNDPSMIIAMNTLER